MCEMRGCEQVREVRHIIHCHYLEGDGDDWLTACSSRHWLTSRMQPSYHLDLGSRAFMNLRMRIRKVSIWPCPVCLSLALETPSFNSSKALHFPPFLSKSELGRLGNVRAASARLGTRTLPR